MGYFSLIWPLSFLLIPVAGVLGWWRLPPEREFAALATLLCIIAAMASAAVGLYMSLGGPCGGDGGSPYAHAGSPAADFCNGIGAPALLLLPAGAVLVGAALRRWLDQRGALWFFFVAGVAAEYAFAQWASHLQLTA